jgi:hypothetical protein
VFIECYDNLRNEHIYIEKGRETEKKKRIEIIGGTALSPRLNRGKINTFYMMDKNPTMIG